MLRSTSSNRSSSHPNRPRLIQDLILVDLIGTCTAHFSLVGSTPAHPCCSVKDAAFTGTARLTVVAATNQAGIPLVTIAIATLDKDL